MHIHIYMGKYLGMGLDYCGRYTNMTANAKGRKTGDTVTQLRIL